MTYSTYDIFVRLNTLHRVRSPRQHAHVFFIPLSDQSATGSQLVIQGWLALAYCYRVSFLMLAVLGPFETNFLQHLLALISLFVFLHINTLYPGLKFLV
jgi:hypothetical protein